MDKMTLYHVPRMLLDVKKVKEMDPLKEIERIRTTLSDIAKEHPDLETIVQDANDDL